MELIEQPLAGAEFLAIVRNLRKGGVGLSYRLLEKATPAAVHRRLPPYWTVRAGNSFAVIAARTGLTMDQLQAYNPNVDPLALTPGQRLNLWQHPPQPPKARQKLGPMFWTVRPGQSFGSIAAATKISIVTLEELDPNLKPASVQPGNQVRLRR